MHNLGSNQSFAVTTAFGEGCSSASLPGPSRLGIGLPSAEGWAVANHYQDADQPSIGLAQTLDEGTRQRNNATISFALSRVAMDRTLRDQSGQRGRRACFHPAAAIRSMVRRFFGPLNGPLVGDWWRICTDTNLLSWQQKFENRKRLEM